jgi:hypothetical protein
VSLKRSFGAKRHEKPFYTTPDFLHTSSKIIRSEAADAHGNLKQQIKLQ